MLYKIEIFTAKSEGIERVEVAIWDLCRDNCRGRRKDSTTLKRERLSDGMMKTTSITVAVEEVENEDVENEEEEERESLKPARILRRRSFPKS